MPSLFFVKVALNVGGPERNLEQLAKMFPMVRDWFDGADFRACVQEVLGKSHEEVYPVFGATARDPETFKILKVHPMELIGKRWKQLRWDDPATKTFLDSIGSKFNECAHVDGDGVVVDDAGDDNDGEDEDGWETVDDDDDADDVTDYGTEGALVGSSHAGLSVSPSPAAAVAAGSSVAHDVGDLVAQTTAINVLGRKIAKGGRKKRNNNTQTSVTYLGHKLSTKASVIEAFKDGYQNHGTPTRAPEGTQCANCRVATFDVDLNMAKDLNSLVLTAAEKAACQHPKRINLCRHCVALHMGASNFAMPLPATQYPSLAAALRDAEKLAAGMLVCPGLHININYTNNYGMDNIPAGFDFDFDDDDDLVGHGRCGGRWCTEELKLKDKHCRAMVPIEKVLGEGFTEENVIVVCCAVAGALNSGVKKEDIGPDKPCFCGSGKPIFTCDSRGATN